MNGIKDNQSGKLLAGALLLACFLLLWLPPLFDSLWIDETLSGWVSGGSMAEACHRAVNFQGQSPFYYIILFVFKNLFGQSAVVLRSLSLLCGVFSCLLLYRISRQYLDERFSYAVVLIFIALKESSEIFVRVRPYGMAVMFALFSIFFLIRWVRSTRLFCLLLYCFSTVLTIFCSYLYAAILIFHLVLFLLERRNAAKKGRLLTFISTLFVILAASIIPNWKQINILKERSRFYYYLTDPGLSDFIQTLFPFNFSLALVVSFAVCLLAAKIAGAQFFDSSYSRRRVVVIALVWWALPIFAFYFLNLSGVKLPFLERYFLWHLPALAFLGVIVLSNTTRSSASLKAISVLFF